MLEQVSAADVDVASSTVAAMLLLPTLGLHCKCRMNVSSR
jgi:hypothetical protein